MNIQKSLYRTLLHHQSPELIGGTTVSKSITIGQSHNVISVLANNVDWDVLDGNVLQEVVNKPREAGAQFTAFLKNGGQVIVPKVIPIDRSKPFDPETFIGKGWSIVEQDERSLALTEVDLTEVRFETCIKDGVDLVGGEIKLKRLKSAGHIRLDAKVFHVLWENKHIIPESWKMKVNGITRRIFFDGTVFKDPYARRYVLCFYWSKDVWRWHSHWLIHNWDVYTPSVVLTS
jgi:hypothetical protein